MTKIKTKNIFWRKNQSAKWNVLEDCVPVTPDNSLNEVFMTQWYRPKEIVFYQIV